MHSEFPLGVVGIKRITKAIMLSIAVAIVSFSVFLLGWHWSILFNAEQPSCVECHQRLNYLVRSGQLNMEEWSNTTFGRFSGYETMNELAIELSRRMPGICDSCLQDMVLHFYIGS